MKSVGLLTSMLMLVPMLAIPFLAILGIPQFIPAVASPTPYSQANDRYHFTERRVAQSDALLDRIIDVPSAYDIDLLQPTSSFRNATGDDARAKQLASQWRDPLARKSKTRLGETSPRVDLPQPIRQAANGSHVVESPVVDSTGFARGDTSTIQQVGATTKIEDRDLESIRYQRQSVSSIETVERNGSRQRLSWSQAAQLLDRMGIRKYQLTPGAMLGEFQFTCSVTSVDNPRISREFQAESTDPLVAVENALVQVDDWMNGR